MESWDTVYNPNPRENANIFSTLFFGYTIPLFKKGLAKEIGVEDVYNTLNNDKSNYLGDTLEANWNEQIKLQTLDPSKKPSLLKAILKTFWLEYSSVVLLAGIVNLVLKPLQPQLLGGILDYYTPGSNQTKSKAYLYAFAFVSFTIINSLLLSHFIKKSWHCGIRVKTAVCALIYRKTIRLSKTALGDTPAGKVVNLLSNDVSRFEFASLLLNGLWTGPACALIVIINLYQLSGLPCLAGILIVMLVSPMQGYSGKLAAKFRKQTALKTDERIRLMDEIILGIQVIKMYAWEKPFEKIIATVRKAELKIIKKKGYIINIFSAFNMITIKVALFVTLLTIILSGEQITASKVFVLISYYNMLSEILSTRFVSSVSLVAEAVASMDRLQYILIKDEFKYEQFRNIISSSDEKSEIILSVDNLSARWNTDIIACVLKNINLEIKRGQLVGVIGPVGSGKSALLQTFLGELDIFTGTIKSRSKYSYAAQEAWIFAGTIRQNILFGAAYEKVRYKKVLRVCALITDLKEFPNGDMTIVGEKGASLSGGQKARINLARVIYRDVDIYLLDDPLSAVDIHVSKVLYEECINKFLANKTRILVTHQVHYLKNADNIIILNNGTIETTGTFKELANNNNEYCKSLELDESIDSDRSRTSSTSSYVSQKSLPESLIGDSDNEDNKPKMVDMQEKSSKGKVFGSLLLKYLRSTNNYINLVLTAVLFLLVQTAICGVDYFISIWTSIEESRLQANLNNTTAVFNNCGNDIGSNCANSTTTISVEVPNVTTLLNSATTTVYMLQTPNNINNQISSYSINRKIAGFASLQWTSETCIYIYGGLIVTVVILTLLRAFSFFNLIISCSQNLHNSLFRGIINTKMRFFETNPSGRILNRFTKDIGEIDEAIPNVLQGGSEVFLQMAGALALVLLVNPYTIIVGVALTIILSYVQHNYLKIANDFRRIQGIVRSPVFTHINATLQGLTTIRALGTENLLVEEFDKIQDINSSASLMSICSSTVYGLTLDCISFVFMSILTFSILIFDEAMGVNGSIVGLAISQAYSLSTEIRIALRSTANISNQLMAVERVVEYKELPPETQPANPKNVPPKWPDEGNIIFDNINLKYFEDGPLILKNMNLRIKPREKVGIVGRTGAGKTSLVTALFRLAVVEGTLIIDGFDTKDVPLTTLRSKISIIPQDPVLFTGTLRSNLDPLEKFSDEELYKVLEDVELKDPKNINNKLESTVLDKGSNYSVGQKQLICLARALLKKNKILVLDEATANVDLQTDAIIQKTLRTKFVDCTVITVAHRLNTIMDSDKVLVMAQGEVAEFDHPHILLNNKDGIFFKMVQETGKELAEYLSTIAMHSYQRYVTLNE